MAFQHQPILDSFKSEINTFPVSADNKVQYSNEYKSSIVKFHYKSGMSITAISEALDIHVSILSNWKRKYGSERTAFVHGQSIRNDLRTKCLAVKELVENKRANKETLATKYNVSQQTIQAWYYKFKDNYNDLIDTAIDGIPYLVQESKQIFGNKNIQDFFDKLQDEYEHIQALLTAQHLSKTEKEVLKDMQSRNRKAKSKVEKAVNDLQEAGVKL